MKWKKIYFISAILFLCVQFWFIFLVFHFPATGINVEKNESNQWIIRYFDGRNIAGQLGLETGDRILQIDGKEPEHNKFLNNWHVAAQFETMEVAREDQTFLVSTDGVKRATGNDILPLTVEALSFLMAFLLYRKLAYSRSAGYLALVFATIGTTFMGLVASIRGDTIGKHLISSCVMFVPVIFLHFLLIFFHEKGGIQLNRRYFQLMRLMYIPVMLYFLSCFIYYTDSPYIFMVNYQGTNVAILYFIFGLFVNFYLLLSLFIRYRKEKSFASTIIKTIWVSLLISFVPLVCFSFVPLILYKIAWLDPLYSGTFVLFFPISFAYLIMTKQLYDIEILLRRMLFTVIISLVPSAFLVAVTKSLAADDLVPSRMMMEFILFVIIISSTLYSLEYLTLKLEPVIFPRKHQLQKALRKISGDLASISSFRQLKDIFLVDIVNSIQVYGGAIVFKYKDSLEVISEGTIEESIVKRMVDANEYELEREMYTIFKINHHEEFTSYLIMTQKRTNTRLGLEEIQWINLIVSYLSVGLENIHLVRKLTQQLQQWAAKLPDEQTATDFVWFRKLMFELQEKERVRIATDLHDTTMQDLFFLKDRLMNLVDQYSFREEDKRQIRSMTDYIDVINSNLRQSCFELHPYLLKEVGLIGTIEKLVRFERAVCPFKLEFINSQSTLIEESDMETKRHLFRIVQELINNAKKHSQAQHIRIVLRTVSGELLLQYEDDGIGFDESQAALPEIGSSGIGIAQMKSRVLFLNGRFETRTGKGKGYQFLATIPLKEGRTA